LKRVMGLDIGEKRIGIAISDPLGFTAQGHSVYARRQEEEDVEYLAGLAKEKQVSRIVYGLPRNMNGTEGPQAEKVRAFAALVSASVPDITAAFWDERLTTVAAHRVMIEADMSRGKRKKKVDQLAAVLILQGYLDHLQIRMNREV
jgi:putative Holliday junction resolvase